jgi:hypothetical protein
VVAAAQKTLVSVHFESSTHHTSDYLSADVFKVVKIRLNLFVLGGVCMLAFELRV